MISIHMHRHTDRLRADRRLSDTRGVLEGTIRRTQKRELSIESDARGRHINKRHIHVHINQRRMESICGARDVRR